MLSTGDFYNAEKMALESPDVAKDDVLLVPWLTLKQGKVGEGGSLIEQRASTEVAPIHRRQTSREQS